MDRLLQQMETMVDNMTRRVDDLEAKVWLRIEVVQSSIKQYVSDRFGETNKRLEMVEKI